VALRRFLIDTNIVDRLAEDAGGAARIAAAIDRDQVELVITHIQVDELAAIPDEQLRSRLLIALFRVRPRLVETGVFVLDVSRLNLAGLSDEEEAVAYERRLGAGSGRRRHAEDAILAATAASSGMPLVTENSKDARRFTRGHPDLNLLDYRGLLVEAEYERAIDVLPFPVRQWRPVFVEQLAGVIRQELTSGMSAAPESAPGPDGLPRAVAESAGNYGTPGLHEVMAAVLRRNDNAWLKAARMAAEIERSDLWRRPSDGGHPPARQISARARRYPHLFQVSDLGIRLRQP
jgi:predicted nucleic acid-binding protein